MSSVEELLIKMAKEILGDDVIDVLSLLIKRREEMKDEDIANELNLKINDVRKVLYMLAEQGFVISRRTRDKDTGWYIYFWRANLEQINNIILNRKRAILEKLKLRLEFESSNTFYVCNNDYARYTFDEAFENQFKCPRCGSPLSYYDSEKVKERLRERIEKLEEEIANETKASSN
ncbi:transcription factor [Sulfolobales archaeon HS-7]|nr:transcription factor [Sulfolobales archaeon HS-7]